MAGKLFVFNPTCEMAVANERPSYTPPAKLKQFEENLSTIPVWMTGQEDSVFTKCEIPSSHIELLHTTLGHCPNFIHAPQQLTKIDSLHPWGWSPAIHKQLEPFRQELSPQWFQHPMSSWKKKHKELLSRLTGVKLINQIITEPLKHFPCIEIPIVPLKLSSIEDIARITDSIAPPLLLKTPWSASGRGMFKIRDLNEKAEENPWVKGKLKQQGFMLAEPFLQKVIDVSFHFQAEKGNYYYIGHTYFKTDESGQFIGCYTHSPTENDALRLPLNEYINQAVELLSVALKKSDINKHYNGPVGIDAIFFRNTNGEIKLHPCIEVNLRYTMGLLNLHLKDKIHPQSSGFWKIEYIPANQPNIQAVDKKNEMIDHLLAKGTLHLTPPPENSGWMATLQIDY